jgi:hypothetical protein
MIVVKLSGGLGNQLFQYAAGRRMAVVNDVELKLDLSYYEAVPERSYKLNKFQVTASIASAKDVKRFYPKHSFLTRIFGSRKSIAKGFDDRIITERLFEVNPQLFAPVKEAFLDGYWGDEIYFRDIEELIRKEFELKKPFPDGYDEWSKAVQSVNSVSVHVRRADYLLPEHQRIFGLLDDNYYIKAIEHICGLIERPTFYVFSDEIETVKDMRCFQNLDVRFMEDERVNQDYLEFALMRQCKHNIVANSTFSWWAAWLNRNPEKVVVVPKRWYNDPKLQSAYGVSILRTNQNWIKL